MFFFIQIKKRIQQKYPLRRRKEKKGQFYLEKGKKSYSTESLCSFKRDGKGEKDRKHNVGKK